MSIYISIYQEQTLVNKTLEYSSINVHTYKYSGYRLRECYLETCKQNNIYQSATFQDTLTDALGVATTYPS